MLERLHDAPGTLTPFYRRQVGAVERYAVRRCAQPADVADLLATTFFTVLENATTLDEQRGSGIAVARDAPPRHPDPEADVSMIPCCV